VPFLEAPFFWSEQYDSGLTYVGHAADIAAPEIDGSPEEGSFIAYYMDGDRVAAAAGVWRDEEMARLQAEMDRGVVVRR
jgi:hypothetical protein